MTIYKTWNNKSVEETFTTVHYGDFGGAYVIAKDGRKIDVSKKTAREIEAAAARTKNESDSGGHDTDTPASGKTRGGGNGGEASNTPASDTDSSSVNQEGWQKTGTKTGGFGTSWDTYKDSDGTTYKVFGDGEIREERWYGDETIQPPSKK
jgi:hypothetical protein